jgi:hypothetical protein
MKETAVQQQLTLLEHLDKILEFAEKEGLDETFFGEAKEHIDVAAGELQISPTQAVLFALVLDISVLSNRNISNEDKIFNKIKCSKAKYLEYLNELDELIRKNYVIQILHSDNSFPTYRIPRDFILALRKGRPVCPESYSNLPIKKFFSVLIKTFDRRYNNQLIFNDFIAILDMVFNENKHLAFVKKIIEYDLDIYDRDLLLFFCEDCIDDNGIINTDHIKALFTDADHDFYVESSFITPLKHGYQILQKMNLLENVNNDGFALRDEYQLTKKTKEELFVELEEKKPLNKKNFVLSADITEKALFYNREEEKKIIRLAELLEARNFKNVIDRLGEKGLRKGFACLFSGGPGTGKTETVYQLARRTGRDIMPVDVAKVKSMWVGGSEKNIREVFEHYKQYVDDSEIAPILLFNEADAIMGQRREFNADSRAVDQMEDSIQNIILEEIEKLEGILIATTNLTKNFDKAFERRFIYKIEFQRPSPEARKSIWKSLIPELQDSETEILSRRFFFSGGQIENIARKRTVETVLSGITPSLNTLISYCQDESPEKEPAKIGFQHNLSIGTSFHEISNIAK